MGAVGFGARVFLAAVLFLAAGGKTRAYRHSLPFLPAQLAPAAAGLLIAAEVAIGSLLVLPATAGLGALAAAVLFTGFTAGVVWLLHRGTTAECRCFGGSGTRLARHHAVRNLMLTLTAALTAVIDPASRVAVAGQLTAAAAGLLAAVLVSRWDDLAALLTGV